MYISRLYAAHSHTLAWHPVILCDSAELRISLVVVRPDLLSLVTLTA